MVITRLAIAPKTKEACYFNDGKPVTHVAMNDKVVWRICDKHAASMAETPEQ